MFEISSVIVAHCCNFMSSVVMVSTGESQARRVADKENRGQREAPAKRVAGKIRYASIQLSVNQCKGNTKEENTLKLELTRLEEVFDISPITDIANKLEPKRQLLQKLRESRVERGITRSRAKGHGLGENNSSYFLSLEKREYVSKQTNELIKENGDVLSESTEILQEMTDYYRSHC